MPIAFDATVGGANANSYATVAQADAYSLANLNRSAWLTATDTIKQTALTMATRLLDERIRWNGSKVTSAQRLRWPRMNTYNADGEAVGSTVIPEGVTNATAELAFWLITGDRVADQDNAKLSRIKLDVLELEFKDGAQTQAIPDSVLEMLQPYGEDLFNPISVGLVRG